ncbi:TraR/DksA family transcriptional regulator [Candidatus Parcubacteria bacterium]|nr:TraR/DksA family transcriptional regulator [Candidatus Parcubacteria bacterium]
MAKARKIDEARYDDLKKMLQDRRREILADVQGKMRDARGAGKTPEVLDAIESTEANIQDDIEFALIQMKADTLSKIDEALDRLKDGTYGHCFECGGEISEARLLALPFAARCKPCEDARDRAAEIERRLNRFGGSLPILQAAS